jgi:dihydrofolate reductase
MSLDGFIAGPGGDMSWSTPFMVDSTFPSRIGALLVGNRTFRGDDPHKGNPEKEGRFAGSSEWSGPQFVLTHAVDNAPVPGVTFVNDLHSGVVAAREAAGDKYVNVLGADVARQCIEAGVLDEILVLIAPILLGDGVRLYSGPTAKLEPIGELWYRVFTEPDIRTAAGSGR